MLRCLRMTPLTQPRACAVAAVWATLGLGLAACPHDTRGLVEGASCERSLQCADGLLCNTCTPVCSSVQAEDGCRQRLASPIQCSGAVPVCFVACGTLEPTESGARCTPDGWRCVEEGVFAEDCPTDICWGEPQPGQVCDHGEWRCMHGQSPLGLCYTPGLCDPQIAGLAIAPGCRHTAACSGTVSECQDVWCTDGVDSPAPCIGGTWRCEEGIANTSCPVRCGLGEPPACYAACGDPVAVAAATCSTEGWHCPSGDVLQASCPAQTCWTAAPPTAVACEDGEWLCGDGQPAQAEGCVTPTGCVDAEPKPACFENVCCHGEPSEPTCVDNAWHCGSQNTLLDCAARPFCSVTADAGGFADAAQGVDGGAAGDGGLAP
jgi:hypothetical protein